MGIGFRVLFGREDSSATVKCQSNSCPRVRYNLKDENANLINQITSELRSKSANLMATIDSHFSRHKLCKHYNTSCLLNSLICFGKNFAIGWTSQLVMSTVMRPKLLLSSPRDVLVRHISDKNSLRFGLFMATFSATYKIANCLLRWSTNRSEDWHSLVAALCAGMTPIR